ncbi:glutamine amidotransferase-related protein [Demequina oxidasica]|uniref:glutamine amidotransferase-related protein n=1 Tax=Demequina oxidasica TaxID=676199 RepID=UPI00078303ED|nr:gamma-glutamyl-gamma-aminobutyrate hydrolase family protein [Demequina oxidasica]
MNCVALRHVAFEDLGHWEPEIRAHGYTVTYVDAGVDDLSPVRDADLVIVLGGPIGVPDAAIFPNIEEETALIRERLDAGRPVLGVCLGAQLIAHALGWPVAPGRLELGWGLIDVAPAGMETPLRHISGVPILQWHGDSITAPVGVELLASTDVTACQAFSVGSGFGIQFHPEVDPESFERWLIGNLVELRGLGISIEEFRAQTAAAADGASMAGIRFIRDYLRGL